METPAHPSERQLEILKGFREGGIGMHGTFRGNVPNIRGKGILLPHERGLANARDNVVAYYSTPYKQLIDKTIQAVGNQKAAEVLFDALYHAIKNNIGYAQNEGFAREKSLDWNRWQETPELLPAIVLFRDAGEVLPIEYPLPDAARGSYSSLNFPEMRVFQSVGADRILGSVEITPEDVERTSAFLTGEAKSELRKKCEQLLINRAFEYLLQLKI